MITGASSGIGRALAMHYACAGITLFLTGRNQERLQEVADACQSKGSDVQAMIVDVTSNEFVDWARKIDQDYALDLVIANAGISAGMDGEEGESASQARQVFNVNLGGVLKTIDAVLPGMRARKSGQIAIMSSLASFAGMAGAPAYSASKAAVRVYGEAMRGAVKHEGVRVNVICPGFVKSRITDKNSFPMPFMMKAEKAAKIIANGLANNKARIAFPKIMLFFVWLLATMPASWASALTSKMPKKKSL